MRLEAIAFRLRPLPLGWRPSLSGWRPLVLGWRPSLLGWRPLHSAKGIWDRQELATQGGWVHAAPFLLSTGLLD